MAASAAQSARQLKLAQWRTGMKRGMRRSWALLIGGAIGAAALLMLLALVSYSPTDPSLNTAAAGPVRNWVGAPGAWSADLLLSLFGPPAALLLPLVALIGIRIASGSQPTRWLSSLSLTMLGLTMVGGGASLLVGEAVNGLPASWGGAAGLSLAKLVELGLGAIGEPGIVEPFRIVAVGLFGAVGLVLCWFGLGLRADERAWIASRRLPRRERGLVDEELPEP